MYALYSALLALFLLLTLPYWLLQMMRHGKYRAGLRQRFGAVPRPSCEASQRESPIWVHAVSVGEVVASSAVIAALRQKFPIASRLISTTTSTGQKLATQRFGAENVFLLPRGFRASPSVPISPLCVRNSWSIAETEFWPNFLRLAKKAELASLSSTAAFPTAPCPATSVSASGLPKLLEQTLANVDLFLAQTEEDRRRLIEIGAPESKIARSPAT
jgi:3-deoxy-D-manno-octulosonic-acid transferase